MAFDWIGFGIVILAIIPHEFGHYLAFRFFGYKPTIRLTKWGAVFIGENCFWKLTVRQMLIVSLLGIWAGFTFVFLATLKRPDAILEMTYLLMCVIDINHILNFWGEKRDMTLVEVARKNLKEIEAMIGETNAN